MSKSLKSMMALVLAFTLALSVMIAGCATPADVVESEPVEEAPAEEAPAEEAPAEEAPAEEAPAEEEVVVADDRQPVNIYLVSHGGSDYDAFWVPVEQGIADAEEAFGVDVTLLTPGKFDPEQTASDIDKAIAAQPDALGITVTDGVLFEEPMLRAINAGIPVIAYNAADYRDKEERIPYITYIGQSPYDAGYKGGERLFEAFGGTHAVVIHHNVGQTTHDYRAGGFADALAEHGIDCDILAITEDASEAVTTIGDYFAANPETDMCLTLGPLGANPFYSFMESEGFEPGDIHHGTFDLGPEIVEKIKDGTTYFAIDQQPYTQGFLVVQWLTWIVRYSITPPSDVTPTGPGFVDIDNIETVEALSGTYR